MMRTLLVFAIEFHYAARQAKNAGNSVPHAQLAYHNGIIGDHPAHKTCIRITSARQNEKSLADPAGRRQFSAVASVLLVSRWGASFEWSADGCH